MLFGEFSYASGGAERRIEKKGVHGTVTVIIEVEELVRPLRDDSQGVFEKSDDD